MKVGDKFRITITGVVTLDEYDYDDFQSVAELRKAVKAAPEAFLADVDLTRVTLVALGSKKQGRKKKK